MPKTTNEIIRFFKTGQCGDVVSETKGINIGNNPVPVVEPNRAGMLFDFDSTDIRGEYYAQLQEWGTALTLMPEITFIIVGHTDYIGSIKYNDKLSKRRAQNVKHFLIQHYTIDANRLIVTGYGKRQPLRGSLKYQSEEDMRFNRRVEFIKQP